MKPSSSSPAHPAAERVQTIDILRGLALFGILAANIITFRSPAYSRWNGFNRLVDWLILVLCRVQVPVALLPPVWAEF
jgi:uncharacterized membrane protein YeiB